jgi:hypothetical protein
MKLPSWLQGGAFMSNTQFLAFMGHAGWAALITLAVAYLGATFAVLGWVTAAWVLAAGLKEYWYDANYEVPHQTFAMNTQDFVGYVTGLVIAWMLIAIHSGWF